MNIISFRKVHEPYGWLGNMSPHPVDVGGRTWRTAEAAFQALRFPEGSPVRDLIHTATSPMAAKMIAKAHVAKMHVVPRSNEDIALMMEVITAKFGQHSELREQLLATGEDTLLIEDVTNRPNESALFWGMRLEGESWRGTNALGQILMEYRNDQLRASRVADQVL